MGESFADISVVNGGAHVVTGGGVIVWASLGYGQRTQLLFKCRVQLSRRDPEAHIFAICPHRSFHVVRYNA